MYYVTYNVKHEWNDLSLANDVSCSDGRMLFLRLHRDAES